MKRMFDLVKLPFFDPVIAGEKRRQNPILGLGE